MTQRKWVWVVSLALVFLGVFVFSGVTFAAKTVFVGGTMSLTGPYAEDSGALLKGFEDYVKYVNETKTIAPWLKSKWPADVTIELLWRDDEVKPAKALSIYEELKAKGMLVFRTSSSAAAMALKDRLKQDGFGATTQAPGAYLLAPPGTIFTNAALYTDALAAIADWFFDNWKEKRKPRVAYLTADNAFGRSIEIPQMSAYLEKRGYEFVRSQYVPLVVTYPPTTQLMWLKDNKIDLALGAMINPGAQPTIKEAVRLDMGPHLGYKITFGFPETCIIDVFRQAMGTIGDGVVVGGALPSWTEDLPGVKFALDLQKKYRPNKPEHHTMYFEGIVEAMTQVEALRLAMEKTPLEKLKPEDVLNDGFYQIKSFDVGGLSNSTLTYGPGQVEGADKVRLDHVQNGKQNRLGDYPIRRIH